MQLADRFAKMISYCDQLVLAPFERDRIKAEFEYFRRQSLCDLDRRDKSRDIAACFQTLLQSKKVKPIIDHFRGQPSFWRDVALFVGDPIYSHAGPASRAVATASPALRAPPLATPPSGPPLPPQTGARMGNQVGVDQFFAMIAEDARSLSAGTPECQAMIRFGLRVLMLEAERPRSQRNHVEIQSIWKTIWPVLDRLGLLRRFKADSLLKQRVQSFIANAMVLEDQNGARTMSHHLPKRQPVPDHDYSGKRGIDPRRLQNDVQMEQVCPPTANQTKVRI